MDRGHVKLWRKMIDDEIFYKPNHLQLFLYILVRCAWEDRKYRGVQLVRGQISTGRKVLAKELEQPEGSTYKRLQWLKNKSYITLKSNNKMTVISVCNYDIYQDVVTTKKHQSNNKVTTKEQQGNTIEEVKALEDIKEVKNKYKDVFDYYLTLPLTKHKIFTQSMKDSIKDFMKKTKSSIDDCNTCIKRHSIAVENTKKNEKPIKLRGIAEFFGQKVFNGKELIAEQYLDGGKFSNVKKVVKSTNNAATPGMSVDQLRKINEQ